MDEDCSLWRGGWPFNYRVIRQRREAGQRKKRRSLSTRHRDPVVRA